MKTKVIYPFIYFFMEPNVVFVYKIETQNYVTVSDLNENGEWQTYELEHENEFEMFNHEESNPLEGKGYAIKQSDVNTMVEVVNRCIQKYRHPFSSSSVEAGDQVEAVHIVSSESAAGSLRVGLERPKVVIGFPDSFSIGPLWKLVEKAGQTFRNQWLYEHINYEQDDFEYENKFANTLREIEDIPRQVPIYIWYGNNADEQTGLRFLLFFLRDKTNDVFLMNSTELYERYIMPEVRGQKISHTGHIEPKDLRLLFEKGRKAPPISEQERMQLQEEWNSLAQTKEVLRLWMKGEIKGVKENHFDPLIINTIKMLHRKQEKRDFIKAGMVIGEILSGTNELINAFFLEYRIRNLIYSGLLELKGIPKSMRHYSVKLR
ncbi:hypothetical protein AN957_07580 [Cytobacillus solani]|uniref:DUF1835 domain-containing protein n=2 Tax=Cytobacillus solani TaxID=1637975 RepID=A0A0Q3T4S8_9BACI|nr:hypothetical protein AN957_07580 [Cytobacillus solani]